MSFAILLMGGCGSAEQKLTPSPPLEPGQLLVPTFTSGENFACWSAPASSHISDLGMNSGKLILTVRTYSSSEDLPQGEHLYRFDFSTMTYSLLASDIYDAHPAPGGSSSFTSPDRQYLWFARYIGPSNDAIFIYDHTDGSTNQVPFPYKVSMQEITWSADSGCLIDTRTSVAYRQADGAIQQKTVAGRYQSPTGRWWATETYREVHVVDMEGNIIQNEALHLSIKDDEGGRVNLGLVTWSPNGDKLAFAYGKAPFYAFDTVRIVYFEQDNVVAYQDITLPGVGSLDWSPNRRHLLMTEAKLGEKYLHIFDAITDMVTTLPQPIGYGGKAPAWSPSGQQIAFASEDSRSLYVINADGTGLSQLPSLPSNANNAELPPSVWRISWIP